ncbi:MAG: hypothetical protein PGN34_00400 [Methylobacterium frigidaeris]
MTMMRVMLVCAGVTGAAWAVGYAAAAGREAPALAEPATARQTTAAAPGCAGAAWPYLPAGCPGARPVRMVGPAPAAR